MSGTQAPAVSLIHHAKYGAFHLGTSILEEEEDLKKRGLLPLGKLPRSLPGHFCFHHLSQHFYMDEGIRLIPIHRAQLGMCVKCPERRLAHSERWRKVCHQCFVWCIHGPSWDLGPPGLVGLSQGLVLMTSVFAPSHTVWTTTVLMIGMNVMLMDDDDDKIISQEMPATCQLLG